MILRRFPPMGVYETLFRFADATGSYMGEPGTHPWAQGFPLTTQLPGGPPLPEGVSLTSAELKYPPATGHADLRRAIANAYNDAYGTRVNEENVAVFAGGRPAIYAILAFLLDDVAVAVEETEYTPYFDALRLLRREHRIIPSNPENRFRPGLDAHRLDARSRLFLLKSNPCNPTGVTVSGGALRDLVELWTGDGRGALFDEAYEMFADPSDSALRYVDDLDETDLFVVGAATKGLQAPGIRVGWAIAARRHVEILRNYSSIGMGGVSRLSQLYAAKLLEPARVRQAREAVARFYGAQRARYAEGLSRLGFELFTGGGGFYHWARLPGDLTADAFNERLFAHRAALLPGRLCDMHRREGAACPLERFVRFSFGPLPADSYDEDLAILKACL